MGDRLSTVPGVRILDIAAANDASGWHSVSDALTGYTGAQLVSSAFTGTIQCQGSNDGGTTSVALQIVNMADGTTGTGITANGIYRVDAGGVARFRWICSAFTSATDAALHYTLREG